MPARLVSADLAIVEEREAFARARRDLERLLRYRPRSRREAEQRLTQKGYRPETIEQVLAEAEQRGWLNDEAFAKLWIADRLLSKPKGARALRSELLAKGISAEIIAEVLAEASLDEGALARELAEQHWARYPGDDPLSRERKLAAFLARRGFAPSLIRATLRELTAEHRDASEL